MRVTQGARQQELCYDTRRILVAVDDSPLANGVFDAGAEYARLLRAEIYLLRTITVPAEVPPPSDGDESLPLRLAYVAEQDLETLAQRAPDISVVQTLITFGLPGPIILEAAETLNVDLVVLGSHSHRCWDRVRGTTASFVAKRSNRNVLVVHVDRTGGSPRRNSRPVL